MFMIGTALFTVRFAEKQLGGKHAAAWVGAAAGVVVDFFIAAVVLDRFFGISIYLTR
ncbi:MAG: hypothetical protein KGZ92_09365 [Firmicutes bacterium]|nr:hypothetical protein [Dethiobacter sp.]MBS3889472.1 hypothetical protein [Bacillota bacterium]